MKKNILLTGCLLLALTSCYQAVLDPLQGVYPAPTVVDFSGAGSCEATKVDGKRYFELNLSEAGTTLVATLVGDAYYLTSNAYTEAEEAAAKKGNFILGKTSVNGTPVKTGTINITQDGDAYRMKAVLFLSGVRTERMLRALELCEADRLPRLCLSETELRYSAARLREFCRASGVHIYCETDDILYVT